MDTTFEFGVQGMEKKMGATRICLYISIGDYLRLPFGSGPGCITEHSSSAGCSTLAGAIFMKHIDKANGTSCPECFSTKPARKDSATKP